MSQEEPLSRDQVFNILSSARRRYVLYYLRQHGATELSELSSEVAAWENETEPDNLTDQQRKRVYVSLYQTHIPQLEDVGLIEYDQDEGLVSLTNQADTIDRFLESEEPRGFPWELYYLGLAVLSGVLVLGNVFGVAPLAAISPFVLMLVIVVAFGLSALGQLLLSRFGQEESIPSELHRRD